MNSALTLDRQNRNQQGRIDDLNNKSNPVIERKGGGIEVRGTKTLYMVVALREYDEDNALVAVGAESDPLSAGHTLQPTWDWERIT